MAERELRPVLFLFPVCMLLDRNHHPERSRAAMCWPRCDVTSVQLAWADQVEAESEAAGWRVTPRWG